MKLQKKQKQDGFTLLEVLIYIAVLVLVIFIVINSVLMMSESYVSIKMNQKINQTAMVALDRIATEIKWSDSLGSSGSSFGSDSGVLSLNSLDSIGSAEEVRFFLDGTDLKIQSGALASVVLNTPGINVEKFLLNQSDTAVSKLIKIELRLTAEKGGKVWDKTFYDSVTMREAY